jgi:hypothetical protein
MKRTFWEGETAKAKYLTVRSRKIIAGLKHSYE